ncbi:CBS domain-containing protein [Novibacillus thermophilus]|uniref:CBS domain-containing protein n=1 Tax=Novibacillus thermophilus TaxID=1471761 RepID=A0A1U9K8C5_9BACL|nr:CBS domain-containing protein [Novibacillus thermophilus]AQS56253.1 CBS domain-containing protein [Novibacillus thermophilus]
MREETLRDIMTTNVTYSNPQDPVMQAAQKMKQLNVGSIPVCDANQNVIGMITDRDICLRCVADNLPNSTPVQQVMSQNVVTASPDMTVDKAAHLMSERQIRRLPVVENGKMVGIVAIGDLATRHPSAEEAGHALSDISSPSQPLQ